MGYEVEDLTLKCIHSIFVHFPANNLSPDKNFELGNLVENLWKKNMQRKEKFLVSHLLF